MIGGRYGGRTASTVVHRTAPRRDVTGTRRPQICLVHIAGDNRAFRNVYGFDTAQTTNWTGRFSSNWFLSGNWDAGFPRHTTDANIDTVTPNSTAVTSPGALAKNLAVGQNGIGTLTIQTGGTLADFFGTVGNLAGGLGMVTVIRSGLQLVQCRKRSSRRPGHWDPYNSRRRHGE